MPGLPSTQRGAATSRRILDAAAEEFARHGIAGARIERIISTARTNKAQVYGYFGNKEGLFDAVVADCVDQSTAALPFDADDLPGWAVRLYDENLHRPNLVRLIAWIQLERRPAGRWFDSSQHEHKIAAIAQAQAAGRLRPGDPFDLLTLVIAMANAWSPTSSVYTATEADDPAEHERRRTLLHDFVARAVTSTP
ncbi:TetR/AcrR family transcriptional regulator [Streptomyces sp. HNM0575]|uniref:TetR family transcriptional regulator n=1 Tax=Streptomyces sp. HNM0575 TaxID=2716338 RepID=UPI00145DE910|nr:TetR family transcriptional regulator [Streptomyces sp. HNM0575]NLU75278.1 TetR/AcrR family transcriptional regulator [Streptomyces sp. HNM0575]